MMFVRTITCRCLWFCRSVALISMLASFFLVYLVCSAIVLSRQCIQRWVNNSIFEWYSNSWHWIVILVFARYFPTEFSSYSYLKLNIFIFIFAWFSKPKYYLYSYSVEVWKPNSINFTKWKFQIFCFTVLSFGICVFVFSYLYLV